MSLNHGRDYFSAEPIPQTVRMYFGSAAFLSFARSRFMRVDCMFVPFVIITPHLIQQLCPAVTRPGFLAKQASSSTPWQSDQRSSRNRNLVFGLVDRDPHSGSRPSLALYMRNQRSDPSEER